MATTTEVLQFALRQGPLRRILHPPIHIDERIATTSTVPPAAARGARHRPLPFGTTELLATDPVTRPAEPLGPLLVTAFGLQRREPANPANDHRVVASVRSKFPVHVLVLGADGSAGYLDLYRHALVDLEVPAEVVTPLRPEPDSVTVVLGARHTDFPTPYGILRCALADLETGINLRGLLVAAQLFGVEATARTGGPTIRAAADLLTATGTGSWAAPVVVTLRRTGPLPAYGTADAGPSVIGPDFDLLLRTESAHPTLLETAIVNDIRRDDPAPVTGDPAAAGIPTLPPGQRPDWARVLWNRSAGRVPAPLTGFSARPASRRRECLEDMLGWAGVPAPTAALRGVGERVRLTLAAQHLADLPTGRYSVGPDGVRDTGADPQLLRKVEQVFGYPLTERNDCGVRHSLAVWVFSVDLRALVTDLGPASWGLLQVYCGWVAHGLTMAAATHRLFARPARSFDEHQLAELLRLPDHESPVFITICGQSRYAEPMLDLRV